MTACVKWRSASGRGRRSREQWRLRRSDMGLDNGAKSRARRKHRDRCETVKGNTMREKLEKIWEDELVRAPGHVAGHLTEAAAVEARKGYYKNGKPQAVVTLDLGGYVRVERGVPMERHPVTDKLRAVSVRDLPPVVPEPSEEELVTCLGRPATKPRPFKIDWPS